MSQTPFTVLIEFEIPPDRRHEFVDRLSAQIGADLPGVDGFLSATVHAALDGGRVVNYARWESRRAWETATGLDAADTADLHGRNWDETQRDQWFDASTQHNPVQEILADVGGHTRGVTAFGHTRTVVARDPA